MALVVEGGGQGYASRLVHAKTRRREVLMLVHDAFPPFLESSLSEVDQQAQRHLEQAKIGQDLLPMHCGKLLHRFQLDKHKVVDHQFRPEPFVKTQPKQFDAALGRPKGGAKHQQRALNLGTMLYRSWASAAAAPRVELLRDSWGTQHIFATEEADGFFRLGCDAAEDRLLQMELIRREAAGRLAEVFGPDRVDADRATPSLEAKAGRCAGREGSDSPASVQGAGDANPRTRGLARSKASRSSARSGMTTSAKALSIWARVI